MPEPESPSEPHQPDKENEESSEEPHRIEYEKLAVAKCANCGNVFYPNLYTRPINLWMNFDYADCPRCGKSATVFPAES